MDNYSLNVLNQNENDGVDPINPFEIMSYAVLAVGGDRELALFGRKC